MNISQDQTQAEPGQQQERMILPPGVYVLDRKYGKFIRGEAEFPVTNLTPFKIALGVLVVVLILLNTVIRKSDPGTANGMTVIFGILAVLMAAAVVQVGRMERIFKASGKLLLGEIVSVSQRRQTETETQHVGEERYTVNKTVIKVSFGYQFRAPDGTTVNGSIEKDSDAVPGYPHVPPSGTPVAVMYGDNKVHMML